MLMKKYKKNLLITSIIFFVFIIFYLLLNKSCLNLPKVFKSYKDFGYANIKSCRITSVKSFIRIKIPKLFSNLSSINRHYFSTYDKNILDLDHVKNIESKEKKFFKDVSIRKDIGIKILKDKGIKGLKNTNQKISYNSHKEYKRSYKSYSRQNKDHSNSKFYDEVNLKKIDNKNKPSLAWKHVSVSLAESKSKWTKPVEISPVYFNGKIFYVSSDNQLIALNAESGKILWEKELLFNPSRRGFIIEKDLSDNENLYIVIGSNLFKINALNGDLIKNFGTNGSKEGPWTAFSPFIYKENLIIVSRSLVFVINKENGKITSAIKFFSRKNYAGALPWGGGALDEKRGLIYFSTGNPRPKVYGVKRQGVNHGANTIFCVDLESKKVLWQFKETFHDLWNLDVAFPPILTTVEANNIKYDVVIILTKTGNFIMLERTTGKPIYDIDLIKAPKSKIISELTSPYQLKIQMPEPITKFEWSLDDISKLENKTKDKILKNLEDYEFGLFVPPSLNKAYVYMAEGPIWEGGAINKNNQKLYQTVNHTPTIVRSYLESLWPHSRVKKNFKAEAKLYQKNCASCHGKNRNGKYKTGNKPDNKQIETKIIPSLVGYHLFDDLKTKINNYDNFKTKHPEILINKEQYAKLNTFFDAWDKDLHLNKRIEVKSLSTFFVDENKNFMSNYPQGEIVSYDLNTGKKDWKIPFGYENENNVGTFNRGGLSLSNDGTLFATGTPDKKIFAFDGKNGEELWSYEMDLAGTAPPILYKINGENYLSVLASGGYNFKFPDRGSILYTFKVK